MCTGHAYPKAGIASCSGMAVSFFLKIAKNGVNQGKMEVRMSHVYVFLEVHVHGH